MTIAQQKTPLRFLTFSIDISRRLVITWQHEYQVHHRFTEYLSSNNNFVSFFFDPVSPDDIEREILSIPKNNSYGLYSYPIRILSCAKHILSGPLADIFNMSVQKGIFPS